MAYYEYLCPECGIFEIEQKITEKKLISCPDCNEKVERLISSTSFALSGSGWYKDGYSNKVKKKESND